MSNPTFNNLTVLNAIHIPKTLVQNITNDQTVNELTTEDSGKIFVLPTSTSGTIIYLPDPVVNPGLKYTFLAPPAGTGVLTQIIAGPNTGYPQDKALVRGSILDLAPGAANGEVVTDPTTEKYLRFTGATGEMTAEFLSDGISYNCICRSLQTGPNAPCLFGA